MISARCRTFQEGVRAGWVLRHQQYLEAEPAELQASSPRAHSPGRICSGQWQVIRGRGKFSGSTMLCNCFPFWKSRGPRFARAAALFKHRELEFLSHQHILSADSAWATHKRVANPDSYPLSQEESKLILTPGQRPSPGLSCYLDQPDGERPKESRVATDNTTERSRFLPLSLREGKLPLRCLLNTVKQHFGCGQTREAANVLIPSTSLCARHSSRCFRHTGQYSSSRGRAPL